MEPDETGVDLSRLHAELDRLKVQLCRCRHQGQCLACQGFEVLRQQAQTVVAAASQPVLMQVAQEAAAKDLIGQLGGMQEKLVADPELQELFGALMERIQDDLGGPSAMQDMMGRMGIGVDNAGSGTVPFDDRPTEKRNKDHPADDSPHSPPDDEEDTHP